MRRSKQAIEAEIKALQALKPIGPWEFRTAGTIKVVVAFLRGEVDTTADEFFELPEHHQFAVTEAESWRDGYSEERPSGGWDGFVEVPKAKGQS